MNDKPISAMIPQEIKMELAQSRKRIARLQQENEELRERIRRLEARLKALHEARQAVVQAAYQTGQAIRV